MESSSKIENTSKIAAIWARVSGVGQAETSLPDQVSEVKAMLEGQGWEVPSDKILMVDWASQELGNCPPFKTLQGWAYNQEIGAVGILHRDRLEAIPVQRLLFIKLCQDKGVKLLPCQGAPVEDSETGQLIEFVSAWAKNEAVGRAQFGAKFGMRKRAKERGLPTSHHKVAGYRWAGETPEEIKVSRKLVPTDDWDTVKFILDRTLEGATEGQICRDLKARGIASSTGKDWTRGSIYNIQRSHIYAGRYYALTKQAVEPVKRICTTYGKTSARLTPEGEAIHLPGIEVVNPPVTWTQHLQILDRLEKNKKLAKRNSKADYLLRGFISCGTHLGKKGRPRIYNGAPDHIHHSFVYKCPIKGCAHSILKGPETEELVKFYVDMLVNCQPEEFYEYFGNRQNQTNQKEYLLNEQHSLETKYNKNISQETELEHNNLQGQVHPEVYRRLKARYQTARIYIEDRKQATAEELKQLEHHAEVIASLDDIRARFIDRMSQLTKAEWRELFIILNLSVHVKTADNTDWPDELHGMFAKGSVASKVEVHFGIPLPTEQIEDIMFNRASPD